MTPQEYYQRIANAKSPIEVALIKKEAKQSLPQTKSTLNGAVPVRTHNLVKVAGGADND